MSPPGGLWCSLSLPAPVDPDPFWTLLLASAAHSSLIAWLGPRRSAALSIKWPNDLMVADRKWGGVLAEVRSVAGHDQIVFGLGLDLEMRSEQLPESPDDAAEPTSIRSEFGSSPSPPDLLPDILSRFDESLLEDRRQGRKHSLRQVKPAISTLGRRIRWSLDGRRVQEGIARDLRDDGALLVDLADRTSTALTAGRVRHVRGPTP